MYENYQYFMIPCWTATQVNNDYVKEKLYDPNKKNMSKKNQKIKHHLQVGLI